MLLVMGCSGPSSAELFENAEAAFAAGQHSEAAIHLRNLLRAEPDHMEARTLLGSVSVELGDFSAAETQLRRALELGAAPERIQLPMLRALVGLGRYEDAIELHDSGPRLTGAERVLSLRVAAAAQQGLGSIAEAEQSYREALALNPGAADLRTELAALVLSAGRTDEAQEIVAGVLAGDPNFGPALVVEARIHQAAGRLAEAEQTYRRAMRASGEGDAGFNAAQAALIEVLLRRGAIDEAAVNAEALLTRTPAAPVARYLAALVEFERRDLSGAEARLLRLVNDYPRFVPANRLLGMVKAGQQQFGQAEMYLQAAVAADPDDTTSRALLAQTYMRQNKVNEARNVLARAMPAAESEAFLYALAARTSQQLGEIDLAAEFYSRSEEVTAATPDELFNLASFYVSVGEFDRAVRILEGTDLAEAAGAEQVHYLLAMSHLARGDTEAAADSAGILASAVPGAAWPRTLQGTIALADDDFADARGHFIEALEIEPNNLSALLNLARTELLLGSRESARDALAQVVTIDPNQTAAALALAEIALNDNDIDAAREMLALMPESAERQILSGAVTLREGRLDEAVEIYRNVYAREPTQVTALLAYSVASRASADGSDEVLRDWLERAPGDLVVRFTLGAFELGRGNFDAAAQEFEDVIAEDPAHAPALNNLAWLYGERGDLEAATEMALRAYQAAPQSGEIADTLGWLHVRSGDPEGGLQYLDQALLALPGHPEIQYHRGVALADSGDSENAIAALEAALGDDRDFAGREDASRRLASLRN